ncbi:Hypothetical predicted protein [Xyrichtys novacula]|uniref:Uncharacterized protein n=1 Tax=Xyrichtys novacula TaxID=13765 RepID=A0AAV1HDP6_XYRNO|nr:Hypothetical predicted protein [Xyrichtys novacula]
MFLMGPLIKLVFFPNDVQLTKPTKSNNDESKMRTKTQKRLTLSGWMSVDTFVLTFSNQRGNPAVFVFFSPSVNFVVDTLKRQEQLKAATATDWRSSIAPSPRQQSAFSLPKEFMCMFKAHSLSLERDGFFFLFQELICLTMSTFKCFFHPHLCIETGPSDESRCEYRTSQCTFEKEQQET